MAQSRSPSLDNWTTPSTPLGERPIHLDGTRGDHGASAYCGSGAVNLSGAIVGRRRKCIASRSSRRSCFCPLSPGGGCDVGTNGRQPVVVVREIRLRPLAQALTKWQRDRSAALATAGSGAIAGTTCGARRRAHRRRRCPLDRAWERNPPRMVRNCDCGVYRPEGAARLLRLLGIRGRAARGASRAATKLTVVPASVVRR